MGGPGGAVGWRYACQATCDAFTPVLAGFDPTTGAIQWELRGPPQEAASALLRTQSGSVLFSVQDQGAGYGGHDRVNPRAPAGVLEVSAAGEVLNRHRLCEAPRPIEHWALHAGRLVVFSYDPEAKLQQVQAFDLPQPLQPALTGWSGPRGGAQVAR